MPLLGDTPAVSYFKVKPQRNKMSPVHRMRCNRGEGSLRHKQQIADKSALLHRQLQPLYAPIPARFLTGLTESDVQFD